MSIWNTPTASSLGEVIFSENFGSIGSNTGGFFGEGNLNQGYVTPKITNVPVVVTPLEIIQPGEIGNLFITIIS